jgi:hypothetical protein
VQKVASYEDENDDSRPVDYGALGESPTKLVKEVRTTPPKNIIPTPLRRMNALMSSTGAKNSNNTGGGGAGRGVREAGRASATPTVASVTTAGVSGASPSNGSSEFDNVVTPEPAVQQEAVYGDEEMNITQSFPS